MVIFSAAASAASNPRAEAHTVDYIEVIAQHSGKSLDIVGGSGAPGALTHQWSCVNVAWQRWEVQATADPAVHIIKNEYTGLCLDVPNGTPSDGLQLWQWTCNGTDAQKWIIPTCTGCWGQVVTKLQPGTPRCMDVALASESDGAAIRLWPCNGTAAQRWQFGPTAPRGGMPFTGKWGSGDGYTDARPDAPHHLVECAPRTIAPDPFEFAISQVDGYCTDHPGPDLGGDWSVDVFAFPNTQVKYWGLGIGVAASAVTARVRGIAPTCGNDSFGQAAGNTVYVDFLGPGNYWYGWMSFGHLKDIPSSLTPGDTIYPGQLLGRTHQWAQRTGCWNVSNSNGVHTHIEMWNSFRFACYRDWVSLGSQLAAGVQLGDGGRAIYSQYRMPCV